MKRIYKFETVNRLTSELYPEEYWRMGTMDDIKQHYMIMLNSPNLVAHVTKLNENDEGTFIITLNREGYDETNIISYYKVRILIKKLEMLDKRIHFKIRLVNLKNGNDNTEIITF